MYNWETFQAAYQAASEEEKSIIDSDVIPKCVQAGIRTRLLDAGHYKNVVRLYSLFTLSAIDKQTLSSEMKKVGVVNEEKVIEMLLKCQTEPQATDTLDLESEINEVEATLTAIPHIRTMANDMNRHQVEDTGVTHTSSQDSILQR